MNVATAKEYIFHHIAALKLTEKEHGEVLAELDKWKKRVELARSRGTADMAVEAEKEAGRVQAKVERLAVEITDLKAQIENMRKGIPALAARERTVDPDLLEQELLIILGKDSFSSEFSGGGTRAEDTERDFEDVEAGAALEALKTKMGLVPAEGFSGASTGGLAGGPGGLETVPKDAP
jgi:chaperonin cofactor prefoldin